MKLIETREGIVKLIKSIATRGKRLDQDIHLALCSAVNHRTQHGDNTLMSDVINAMPKGSRANAAILWCITFGGVDYAGRDKAKRVKFKNNGQEVNLNDGIASPFWEQKGAKEGVEFDPEKDIKAVIGILTRHAEKAEEAGQTLVATVYREMVSRLEAVNPTKEDVKEAA